MGRSILSGSVLGAILSALVLAAVSLMLPLAPSPAPVLPDAAVPEAHLPEASVPDVAVADAAPDVAAPDAAAPQPETPAPPPTAATAPDPAPAAPALPVPATAEAPAATVASAPLPDAPAEAATEAARPVIVEVPAGSEFARAPGDALALRPSVEAAPTVASAPAAPLAAPEVAPAPAGTDPGPAPAAPSGPAAPGAPSPEAGRIVLPQAEQPLPVPPPGEALAPTLPAAARTDLPAVPDVLLPPVAPGAALPAPEADTAPGPAPARVPTTPPPQTAALPDIILVPDAAPAAPAAAPVPQPGFAGVAATPGFGNAPGIAVNRLPLIGAEPAPVAEALAPPQPPIEAYRAEFTGTGAPLLALVLLDPSAESDLAALSALGLPLTIAIDPTRDGAAADAQSFRAAGFEVAILAAPLPAGATPGDLEVALAAWHRVVPEAVAVVEPPVPVIQGNRGLAQQLVSALAREGLGLATHSGKGLNAAEQLASAAGVPQVLVWRVLDSEGDTAPAIRRYLDRAAFEAARGQGVAVMLHAWPESLAGLADWQRRRDGGPELAPLSALALATGAF
ncbi:MAG: divergent polysaccharide deacetylase family protein [Rhodobacteraceae bacterium]|nr:divergent polysaccharide deacetylase family protein [Paracoccaceae bacterium]